MTSGSDPIAEFGRSLEAIPRGSGAEAQIELLLGRMSPRRADLLRRMAIPHTVCTEIMRVLVPELDAPRANGLFSEFARLSILSVADDELLMHDAARQYLVGWWLSEDRRADFRETSLRLTRYYRNSSTAAPTAERPRFNREAIFHAIGADPEDGFPQFEQTFRRERYRYALSECARLIRLVREYGMLLSPEQRLWLEYHDGKLLTDLYSYPEAEEKLQGILRAAAVPAELEIRVLYRLGLLNNERRAWRDSIDYLRRSVRSAAFGSVDPQMVHRILDALGTALREGQEINEAETVLNEELKLAKRLGDDSALARSYNSIGLLHRKRNDALPAIEAFEKSLAHLQKRNEHFKLAQVYNNLGLAWADKGDWRKSEEFLRRSFEIERSAGDTRRQATALANLFRVYATQGKLDEAFNAADDAIRLSIQIHDWFSAAAAKRSKARVLRRQGRIDEARKEFNDAAALFQRAGLTSEQSAVDAERERLGTKVKLPWYARIAVGLAILFGVVVLISIVIVLGAS